MTTGDVVFVDTETTGLDPDRHEIWEVGLIVPGGDGNPDREYHWYLPVDLSRADAVALNIGRYHQRHPDGHRWLADSGRLPAFAREFAQLTWGKHLAGAVVSFDAERLTRLLRANGECPGWHYHLIDVEALAVGYLAASGIPVGVPWKSDQLTAALGVDVAGMDKHTALGDARWAAGIYRAVMGGERIDAR